MAKLTIRDVEPDASYLVPLAFGLQLASMCKGKMGSDTVILQAQGTMLGATRAGRYAYARLVDAQFPPYGQVIPDRQTCVTFDRAELAEGLRSMAALASKRTGGVVFAIRSGVCTLTSGNDDGSCVLRALVDASTDRRIGFNARYWLDMLASLPKKGTAPALAVCFGPAPADGAYDVEPCRVDAKIGTAELVYVIMPMRI